MSVSTALLGGLIDYAGLFPPASLDMASTVRNFAAYRRGAHAWMLGRIVVPAGRLQEFDTALRRLPPEDTSAELWRVSALVGAPIEADLLLVAAYNETAPALPRRAIVDAIEIRAATPDEVSRASARVPDAIRASFEIAPTGATSGARPALLSAIAAAGATAKIRTGGSTAAAIPPTGDVAAFIWDCARAGVPFKATAGLHHPVRGEYRLTYAPDSPTAVMHGFLNVFVAAALAGIEAGRQGTRAPAEPPALIVSVLEERDPAAFFIGAGVAGWRDVRTTADQLRDIRSGFALSFGSCSFDEPVADLKALGFDR